MHKIVPVTGAATLSFMLVFVTTGCEQAPTQPVVRSAVGLEASMDALANRPNTPGQLNLTFDKTAVDPSGIWEGRVSGDIEGDLRTTLLGLREAGPIWHVEFLWEIQDDAEERSLAFEARGTLHTRTGRVVMNGVVVEGHGEGARVHEEGQLVDPEILRFQGIININQESAS